MAKPFRFFENEIIISVTSESGYTITLDKETDRVTVDPEMEYSTFNKLVKELKRARNNASFSLEYTE